MSSSSLRRIVAGAALLALSFAPAAFAEAPVGAESVANLYSAAFVGGGAFVTSTGSAQADAVNPAASAREQRIILDAGYAALAGLGKESGVGHALNLGGVLPTKYGVFAGSARLLNSPFDSYPVGTAFGLKASASKELYPGISAGVGVGGAFGTEWSLGADLGLRHDVGTVAFMKNFRWGAAITGLGKGYAPSAFTPTAGIAFDLVTVPGSDAAGPDKFRLGLSADLSAPTFATVAGRLGADADLGPYATIAASTGYHLNEAVDGEAASPIPSFGLTLNFKLAGGGAPAGKLPRDGDLATTVAARPLYGGVWAFGAGAIATLGIVDKEPPAISVDYGDERWISPNNDGKADALEFPLSIADGRYVDSWVFTVLDEAGNVVRTIRNKERRPETQGFDDFKARLLDVKSGVEVPPSLRWDGSTDGGAVAPDGSYLFRVAAEDDNGNRAESPARRVHVDTIPPSVASAPVPVGADTGQDVLIFSPDGDGSKDSLSIEQSGSIEDAWKGVVLNSAGGVVRTFPFSAAAPAALSWDGKDDSGSIVPDGVYRYEIAATDRALNSGSARIDNIIVNTERPPVNLVIDEGAFSPNSDGVKDVLALSPGVPVRTGLATWKVAVADQAGTVRRTFSGAGDVPARVVFDGKAEDGSPLAEGSYQADLVATYRNGYEAKAASPRFVIDLTAPAISVLRPAAEAQRTFSPDGDGGKDSLAIAQSGSREDLWAAAVVDAAGKTVRRFTWEAAAPANFAWDGKDDAGSLVPDGVYAYRIDAVDRAGNKAAAAYEGIVVDTSKPAVALPVASGYYSPNGDGVLDELVLTPTALSPQAVEGWTIELLDPAVAVRRTLRGTGAPAPQASFGGLDEAGKALAEGIYTARLAVTYRNGYVGVARSPAFVLDLTPPRATVAAATGAFSPNGDGSLDTMAIAQTGSDEAAWTGEIRRDGAVVRTFAFAGVPAPRIEWDGTDAEGKLVPDGTYEYRLSAVDRAGNRGASAPAAFALSTADTPVLLVADQRAFSPNGDGRKDTIRITPQLQVAEGVSAWRVDVLDSAGAVVRTWEGAGSVPAPIDWNGRDAKGAVAKDGQYSARAQISYAMGNRPVAASAPFFVDTVAPAISLSVPDKAFSPNADGVKDALPVERATAAAAPGSSGDDEWTLSAIPAVRAGANPPATVRTWTWKGASPLGAFAWDGKDDAGNIVPDGLYDLAAESTDAAGNARRVSVTGIVVDTAAPRIELSAADKSFSPNGDGRKDRLSIAQKTEGDDPWEAAVVAADGTVVRTWTWKGAARETVWDGKDAKGAQAPDGIYRYVAKATDAAGNSAEQSLPGIVLDTVPPALELSFPYTVFSPNGDGRKDELPVSIKTAGDDEWEASIANRTGAVQASWKWKGAAPAIAWNGKDPAGNTAADGAYRFTVRSVDQAGNRTERSTDGLAVDNRATRVFLTASAPGFSPNGDGVADTLRFGLLVNQKEGIEGWRLEILDESGALRKAIGPSDAAGSRADSVPDTVVWNGQDMEGKARDGKLTARLSVSYLKGDLATAAAGPFLLDLTPPALTLESAPRYFSPDNDGVEDELTISVAARDASPVESWSLEIREPQPPYAVFYRAEGTGAPAERIVWDGRSNKGELVQAATDYPATLTAVDALGNRAKTDATIGVDVLVIREGDVLKIKVPSIIFRENGDDFAGLAQETVDNNIRVLKRIAQILNKFKDYKVKVEGHANPVTRTAAEERSELQPLSEKRARAVRAKLIEFGVDSGRLSALGMGGTRPVVKWEDRENWWKNRRVEFILVK